MPAAFKRQLGITATVARPEIKTAGETRAKRTAYASGGRDGALMVPVGIRTASRFLITLTTETLREWLW